MKIFVSQSPPEFPRKLLTTTDKSLADFAVELDQEVRSVRISVPFLWASAGDKVVLVIVAEVAIASEDR